MVAQVTTDPGKTLAHIEFIRDGKYALASLWERKADGGALIVFDAGEVNSRVPDLKRIQCKSKSQIRPICRFRKLTAAIARKFQADQCCPNMPVLRRMKLSACFEFLAEALCLLMETALRAYVC
jgi:hypothetical protein